jgi:hypothetical protein
MVNSLMTIGRVMCKELQTAMLQLIQTGEFILIREGENNDAIP